MDEEKPPCPEDTDENNPALARRVLEAFDDIGGLIEKFTSEVCPTCENVCCIDRHGTHEQVDKAFIRAIGEELPPGSPREPDTEPCRHLTLTGCRIPRWQRPFRCTWYFCDPLLEAMSQIDARAYRRLLTGLQRLVSLRHEFIDSLSRE